MNHTYWFWDSAISGETCDRIISDHRENVKDGTVVTRDGSEDHNFSSRRSKVNFDVSPECRDLCAAYTNSANRQAFGVDLSDYMECQFTMYDGNEDGFYGWHMDWVAQTQTAFDRKLSCIIMLSSPDDYEGGELQLGYDSDPVKPEKGSVFVFPSFLLHQVHPVTSGERFTLVSWAEGPKWR